MWISQGSMQGLILLMLYLHMQQSHLVTHCLEWSDWMCHHWACGAHQTRKRGRYAGRKNHHTETLTDPRAIKYCSVLHVCWNKPKQPSSLRDGWWWHRSVSRALGLLLGINKQNQQWVLAAKGAYGILGCVSKRKASRSRSVVLLLCTALVRLHLVYPAQLWFPHY